MTGPGTFVFLNETRGLEAGWDDPAAPKLWRYNLHYFDDLNAEGAPARRDWHGALIDRWIAENPAPQGSGWEPYPTSLRIVNWVKYSFSVVALAAPTEASRVLIPAFKGKGASLRAVVSGGGASAVHFGKKFGFARACTDAAELYADDGTHGIVIATRHNQHSAQVLAAMQAGKHVFCEKPLCLTLEELTQLEAADPEGKSHLMVGFNRRYAPLVQKMTRLLEGVAGPKTMVLTVNAGKIPLDHWTQDREIGGGRIVGEACHFIDLARHFAGHPVASWSVTPMGLPDSRGAADTTTISLSFEDGSTAAIHYFANGHKGFPKERIEIFAGGRILQLDNFIALRGFGTPGFSRSRSLRQDKGQAACAQAFVKAMQGDASGLIPRAELFEVTRLAIEAEDAARA